MRIGSGAAAVCGEEQRWLLLNASPQTAGHPLIEAAAAELENALVDSVLDFDPASGRTGTSSADALVGVVRERGLEVVCLDAQRARAALPHRAEEGVEGGGHADHVGLVGGAHHLEVVEHLGVDAHADAGVGDDDVFQRLRRDGNESAKHFE